MSDQPERLSGSAHRQFIEGTPVYDSDGALVGHVSKQRIEADHLVIRKGVFFPKDVYVPLSAVQSADASAVHLNLPREELQAGQEAAPHTSEQPASTTHIDRSRPVHTQGRSVIEDQPTTSTQGRGVIEQHPDTYTRGTDEIEPSPEQR